MDWQCLQFAFFGVLNAVVVEREHDDSRSIVEATVKKESEFICLWLVELLFSAHN